MAPGAQDDFALRVRLEDLIALAETQAGRALALEQYTLHRHIGLQPQIGAVQAPA